MIECCGLKEPPLAPGLRYGGGPGMAGGGRLKF